MKSSSDEDDMDIFYWYRWMKKRTQEIWMHLPVEKKLSFLAIGSGKGVAKICDEKIWASIECT